MELVVLGIIFLVGAWAAHVYVAGPAGSLAAVVLAIVGAVCLVFGLFEVLDEADLDDERRDAVLLGPLWLLAKRS